MEKNMDFFEAMQNLKNGEKIRVKNWEQDHFLCLQEESVKIAGKLIAKYKILDQDFLECSLLPATGVLNAQWESIKED